jgi:hypothetical protein
MGRGLTQVSHDRARPQAELNEAFASLTESLIGSFYPAELFEHLRSTR